MNDKTKKIIANAPQKDTQVPHRIVCKGGKMDYTFHVNRLRCKKSKSTSEYHFFIDERKGVVTMTKYRSRLIKNYKLNYTKTRYRIVYDVITHIDLRHIGFKDKIRPKRKSYLMASRVIRAVRENGVATHVLIINDYFVTFVRSFLDMVTVSYFQRVK